MRFRKTTVLLLFFITWDYNQGSHTKYIGERNELGTKIWTWKRKNWIALITGFKRKCAEKLNGGIGVENNSDNPYWSVKAKFEKDTWQILAPWAEKLNGISSPKYFDSSNCNPTNILALQYPQLTPYSVQ